MKLIPNRLALAIASAGLLTIYGCGGGGGGSSPVVTLPDTLNGTALTGAALVNATVTVKDRTGTNCVTAPTDAKGIWSASLANCAGAPFLLKVVGKDVAGAAVTFFSAATASDVNTAGGTTNTVNVSQLTDVIVKVLLKTDTPDTASTTTLSNSVTTANLLTTSQNTLAALVPASVLGTLGTGDIRRMTVTAGSGAGLDGLHDRVPTVEVTVSSGTLSAVATVTNVNPNGATAVTATTVSTTAAPTAALVPPASGTVINNVSVTTPTEVATLSPEDLVKGEVTQMLRDWDKVYATSVPLAAEGAKALAFTDSCYLDDGHDKPLLLTRWADTTDTIRDSNKYRTGAIRSNLNVLNTTFTANADSTKTRTATVKYDITYADGTMAKQAENKLIFGNSASLCATNALTVGENKTSWRFAGNGRQVETNVIPANVQYKKYSLADGSAIPTGDFRQNRLEFNIFDYRSKGYTYAVVTGPGLPTSGVKLLLALTLKNEPLLQGKSGNYLNNTSMDGARICSYKPTTTTTAWDADKADCQLNGGGINGLVLTDTELTTLSIGNLYTFKLYKGDGWKTVNGHSGVTPDLTYTDALPAVPYNSTQFANTGFANFGTTGTPLSEIATMFKGTGGTATASLVNVSGLPAGANAMARRTVWAYSYGSTTTTASFPRLRQINRAYPGNTEANFTGAIPGILAGMNAVSYAELGFSSTDRNGRFITTIYYFQ